VCTGLKQSVTATLAMTKANASTFEYNIFSQLEKKQKIKLTLTDKIYK